MHPGMNSSPQNLAQRLSRQLSNDRSAQLPLISSACLTSSPSPITRPSGGLFPLQLFPPIFEPWSQHVIIACSQCFVSRRHWAEQVALSLTHLAEIKYNTPVPVQTLCDWILNQWVTYPIPPVLQELIILWCFRQRGAWLRYSADSSQK